VTSLKSLLEGLVPPYVLAFVRRVVGKIKPATNDLILFDGDDIAFKELVSKAALYVEYGCGQSTIWASRNSSARIISVDTSQEWVQRVMSCQSTANPAEIHWVDCGPVRDWGTPYDYRYRRQFADYIAFPYSQITDSPDVVLVDGRFRVACFLTSLIHCAPGTTIIFDDYAHRPEYHIVESFCASPVLSGRQAIFVTPGAVDVDQIRSEIEKFSYVVA